MQTILVIFHVTVALLLILIILMQQGSGGGLSGMFGGGGGMDDMLSSPTGDVFFKKATVTLATVFVLTSLVLAIRTSHVGTRSLLEQRMDPLQAPVAPVPGAPLDLED